MKPSPIQQECLSTKATVSLAKSLAPEDIALGDYVAVLKVLYELPTYLWCGDSAFDSAIEQRDQPVRMELMPFESGLPMRVTGVCLPFVMVCEPAGSNYPLDIRRHRLARLDRNFAEAAFKAMKPSGKKPKKKKRK